MFKANRELLQSVLRELDQAVYNHNRWHKDLTRSIICQLPHDQRDLAEDSYRQCPFGQWYYGFYSEEFQGNQTFQSIEVEHRKMHEMAAKLLNASAKMETVSAIDYDNFANIVDRLRINIETLKHEIEETLYNRDPLTGALNRVNLLSDLRKQLELVQRQVQSSSIALMDIDHFKTINDTYGHLVGDQVLSNMAEYIMTHMRPYDKIYRYGGEEFIISMPHTDLETAEMIIERIREGLSELTAAHDGTTEVTISASFGLSMLSSEVTVEDSIDRADQALYHSKLNGRNRVTVWSAEMEKKV